MKFLEGTLFDIDLKESLFDLVYSNIVLSLTKWRRATENYSKSVLTSETKWIVSSFNCNRASEKRGFNAALLFERNVTAYTKCSSISTQPMLCWVIYKVRFWNCLSRGWSNHDKIFTWSFPSWMGKRKLWNKWRFEKSVLWKIK